MKGAYLTESRFNEMFRTEYMKVLKNNFLKTIGVKYG